MSINDLVFLAIDINSIILSSIINLCFPNEIDVSESLKNSEPRIPSSFIWSSFSITWKIILVFPILHLITLKVEDLPPQIPIRVSGNLCGSKFFGKHDFFNKSISSPKSIVIKFLSAAPNNLIYIYEEFL